MRWLIRAFDIAYRKAMRLRRIGPVLLVGFTRYRGPQRVFADGTPLDPGDVVGTLHFDNAAAAALYGAAPTAAVATLRFTRTLVSSLETLARLATDDPELRGTGVWHGITWMRPHGRRLGFEAEPLDSGVRRRLLNAHFRLLLFGYGISDPTRSMAPHAFWLTRHHLLENFRDVARS